MKIIDRTLELLLAIAQDEVDACNEAGSRSPVWATLLLDVDEWIVEEGATPARWAPSSDGDVAVAVRPPGDPGGQMIRWAGTEWVPAAHEDAGRHELPESDDEALDRILLGRMGYVETDTPVMGEQAQNDLAEERAKAVLEFAEFMSGHMLPTAVTAVTRRPDMPTVVPALDEHAGLTGYIPPVELPEEGCLCDNYSKTSDEDSACTECGHSGLTHTSNGRCLAPMHRGES